MKFWIVFGVDAIVACVGLFFFLVGIADGSVSSFNIGLWLAILTAVLGVVAGSLALPANQRHAPAMAVALVLAVPSLLVGLFFLALILFNPRWN